MIKSLPGNSGTTRNLEYDEESRMSALKIGTTTKFEFGYGYDGGRRWSKDLDNNVWSWLPCGVACKAGELVELQSTLAGTTWSTANTNLAAISCGGGLVRSGSQYVLNDLFGRVAQARDSSGTLVASSTYDVFGVQRTGSGAFAAGIIRKTYGGNNEDGLSAFLRLRSLPPIPRPPLVSPPGPYPGRSYGAPSYKYPGDPFFDGKKGTGWSYGNWCGRFRGSGLPFDDLDACCEVHDKCMNAPKPNWLCHCMLVACAATVNCKPGSDCERAKGDLVFAMIGLCSGQVNG